MIFIARLNGSIMHIHPELIQSVEVTPDTVITLISSKKLIVKDTPQEIAEPSPPSIGLHLANKYRKKKKTTHQEYLWILQPSQGSSLPSLPFWSP